MRTEKIAVSAKLKTSKSEAIRAGTGELVDFVFDVLD